MRRLPVLLVVLVAGLAGDIDRGSACFTHAAENKVLASIRLRNPTQWDAPFPVEIPAGHLAEPGRIDWSRVRLVTDDGREVPLAIREGRPHWKARLTAPVTKPRAEDLFVFAFSPKRDAWSRIDLVEGVRNDQAALSERGSDLVISYPGLRVTIHAATAMVTGIVAHGETVLEAPLAVTFSTLTGEKSPRKPMAAPRVRLVSKSSTAALTELHFVLEADDRLSVALTYRVHACGQMEILCDERPWQGVSPWVDRAAEIKLPLAGPGEKLPYLVNRAPFYGFKDYSAAVSHVAAIHRRQRAAVLELGEETTNGRRWNRRLLFVPADRAAKAEALAELANKGMVVDLAPASVRLSGKNVQIVHPPGEEIAAKVLAEAFHKRGIVAKRVVSGQDSASEIVALALAPSKDAPEIEGDGFAIRPRSNADGVTAVACTRFGLMQAALRLAESIAMPGTVDLPLVASNPAVHLRGAGFGGGDFEVDFPYGSDAEWESALDQLVAGRMNLMADLGMWSNWKMPVSFRHFPELRSNAPDAYDEVSGAKLAELDAHREHGLKLLRYLHARGVKVWLWLPVGCVPTTYAQKHPEAMAPGNSHCPCFTHPLYNRFLEAFLKELLETYAIDGVVMIRDDNGGLCPCERCKAYIAKSATRSAAWEQYLILYRWLRTAGYRGDIAVYPYFDLYEPRLEPLLPEDLLIVGHGSGAAVLTRSYETLAPMGDTWIDNVFASFRVPTSARMRRLLADRNSFWLGGALRGSELTWQAIGRFGWEPTATVNTLRYQWGAGRFGPAHATAFLELADAYEQFIEFYDLPMLPLEWVKLTAGERQKAASQGREFLQHFRDRLATFRKSTGDNCHSEWFQHLELFATYCDYHLRRLEHFSAMRDLVAQHKPAVDKGQRLPEPVRQQLVAMQREIRDRAEAFDRQMATVPGNMLARTRANQLTRPFKEFVAGYDQSLEWSLDVKQFASVLSASPEPLAAGQPFVLRVELQNAGVCPWLGDVGPRLEVEGDAARLGLTTSWPYAGEPMVFGDRRTIELRGLAPKTPGEQTLRLVLYSPFRNPHPLVQKEIKLRWK